MGTESKVMQGDDVVTINRVVIVLMHWHLLFWSDDTEYMRVITNQIILQRIIPSDATATRFSVAVNLDIRTLKDHRLSSDTSKGHARVLLQNKRKGSKHYPIYVHWDFNSL